MNSPLIDSHVHVVAADRERYPLRPSGIGSSWWRDDPVTVDQLMATMDSAGVDRAVVVQAVGPYGYDCRYGIDAAAAHPDRLVTVVAVDVDDPDAAWALHAMLGKEPVRGVRLLAVGSRDAHGPRWLGDGTAADRVWDVATEAGLTVVLTAFSHQLPRLHRLIDRRPETPAAIDHCGFPDLAGAIIPAGAPLFALAGRPNVYLKVTTHVLAEADRQGDPADVVDQLASAFGSGRLVWGSDFPQTADLSYAEMVALALRACRRLPSSARAAFLGETAAVLWPPAQITPSTLS